MKHDAMYRTLKYLARRGPSHFHEVVGGLDGTGDKKVSRINIYKSLIIAERKGYVKSTMLRRKTWGILSWTRLYELTKDGRTFIHSDD